MQSQLSCNGCRLTLGYPSGATNVQCPLCNSITRPYLGTSLSQPRCRSCRAFLPYSNGSGSLRCPNCRTLQDAPGQVAQIVCGGCQTTLVYLRGARAVKCARCLHVTNVRTANEGVPRADRTTLSETKPSSSNVKRWPEGLAVLVENPMSVDANGKLVRNVVVGITSNQK